MKYWAKKFIDLILYSNLWIGLCAMSMYFVTLLLLDQDLVFDPLAGLILSCTLVIYALHRLVGLSKVNDFLDVERYRVIAEYKSHIWIYAGLATFVGIWCFFLVPWRVRWSLIIPGILSLLYVLPVLGGNKKLRLRDYDWIKIYLIAFVWAYVTVFLPGIYFELEEPIHLGLLFVERALFIFAITLPFDIRDLTVDKHTDVRTIPARLGVKRSVWLGVGCLFLSGILGFFHLPVLDASLLMGHAVLTMVFVSLSGKTEHDYFFTGLMDGTMILQFLGLWLPMVVLF
ncbi:MAG: hypothetical protein AAFV80_09715 [Bacteroidota bacterium]